WYLAGPSSRFQGKTVRTDTGDMTLRGIVKSVQSLENSKATGTAQGNASVHPTIVLVEPDPYLGFQIRLHVPEATVLEAPVGATADDIRSMTPDLVVAG